jgi:gamma-glutamyltranspeptidase/glutathione hydrolase
LRKTVFVALIVAILSSCSAQSATSDNASRDTTGEETTEPTAATPVAESPKPSQSTPTSPAVGASGMVSSAHPLATQAGLKILADGGNAFDVAVAVGAALDVVEPYMSGIGGYGAIVIYDAEKGETRVLDSGSRTPATLDPDVFRPPAPNYAQSRRSAKAASTPGMVNTWETLSND